MKRKITLLMAMVLCLGMLAGCGCKHEWEAATCERAEMCSLCGETRGEALEHEWEEATCQQAQICRLCGKTRGDSLAHTPGEWIETEDPAAGTVHREALCSLCGAVVGAEETAMTTLIRDGLFLFTPEQFLQRVTAIAAQLGTDVTFTPAKGEGLVYSGMTGESQVLIQFFPMDNAPLSPEATEVWCVSYTGLGQMDAAFRQAVFMACDPALTADEAFRLDVDLMVLAMNALSQEELFGYYVQNELLYETLYFPENTLLEGEAASMTNVYASDFR